MAGICLSALSWSSQSGQTYPHKTMAEYPKNRLPVSDCSVSLKMPLRSLPTHSLFGRTVSLQPRIMRLAKGKSLGFHLLRNQLVSARMTEMERICLKSCCSYNTISNRPCQAVVNKGSTYGSFEAFFVTAARTPLSPPFFAAPFFLPFFPGI